LQPAHAIAETARFLRAARGVVFRIKIEEDDFFADEAFNLTTLPSWSWPVNSGAVSPALGMTAKVVAAEKRMEPATSRLA